LIVAVHQPQYLPWLGYFDKMRIADAFCYLDNVQYKKNEWQNRNRIKTVRDWQWLTVPVHYRFPEKINDVKINNVEKWRKKHLHALITNYSRAPFFQDYFPVIEQAISKDWEQIAELNIFLTEKIRELLNLDRKPAVRASELSLREDPTERLIDICRELGGDAYLSGRDGVKYMQLERFAQSGIEVVIQDFNHPVYPQQFNPFQSHLSIVDLLFNCGSQSMEIIQGANKT
jgi:hypothetical protein